MEQDALDNLWDEVVEQFTARGIDVDRIDLDTLVVTEDPNDSSTFHFAFEYLPDTEPTK